MKNNQRKKEEIRSWNGFLPIPGRRRRRKVVILSNLIQLNTSSEH
jgi:hypothetical protein